MKRENFLVLKTNQKLILLLLLLLNSIQVFPIYGDVLQSESTSIIKTDQFLATYNDISQGWININYESDIQPDVSKVFTRARYTWKSKRSFSPSCQSRKF